MSTIIAKSFVVVANFVALSPLLSNFLWISVINAAILLQSKNGMYHFAVPPNRLALFLYSKRVCSL